MSSSAADYEYECTLPLSSSSNHNARKRSSSWWMVPHIDSDHGNHNAFGTDATSATSTTSNTDAHVNGTTRTSTTCNCTNNADAKRMKLHHHAAAAATDAHDSSFQSSAECNSNFVTHRTPPPVRPRRSFHRFGGTGSSSTRSRGTGSSIRFGLRRPPSLRFSPKSVDPGSFVIPFPDLSGEVTNNNNSNNGGHDSDQENASRSRHNRYAPPARPLPLRLRLHTDDIPPVMLFQED